MFEGLRVAAGQVTVTKPMVLAQENDDQLEAMVREHAALIFRVAFSVLRNHQDAEDATQETFLRVLRYRGRIAKVREPRTWLARIGWRVAVERNRKQRTWLRREPEEVLAQVRSGNSGPEDLTAGAEIMLMMQQMIAALPDKLRAPLTLSTLEELSPADISAVLGINEAAVRSRIFRARQILRERLASRLGR
jgi:RNA polymerase sigma-70 factor, ECF subfamily